MIDFAIVLTFDGDEITDARVTLGSLAPTIVHAPTVEAYLRRILPLSADCFKYLQFVLTK